MSVDRADRQDWVVPLDEAREAFLEVTGIEANTWTCGCGCEGITLWARDERALWLAPTSAPMPGAFVIKGFSDLTELEDFVERMRMIATAAGDDLVYINQLAELLLSQFRH